MTKSFDGSCDLIKGLYTTLFMGHVICDLAVRDCINFLHRLTKIKNPCTYVARAGRK